MRKVSTFFFCAIIRNMGVYEDEGINFMYTGHILCHFFKELSLNSAVLIIDWKFEQLPLLVYIYHPYRYMYY